MRATWLFAVILVGCGTVHDKTPAAGDAMSDAPTDAMIDATDAADAMIDPPSCLAIHTMDPALPSGNYTIDPDGADGDAPITVTCDMATDGGGWTIVYFPPSEDVTAPPMNYTAGNARLMADAQHVLIAFRSATQLAYANYARFDLPLQWRAKTPFDFVGDDVSTGVSINGNPLVTHTVRYGRSNFQSLCSDPWATTSDYGRFCIDGTDAPYFSHFTLPGTDHCSLSSQPYITTPCSEAVRFSIAVR
jgi:hypothetical protein